LKLKSRRLQKQIDRNQLDLQLDIERLTASREEFTSQSLLIPGEIKDTKG